MVKILKKHMQRFKAEGTESEGNADTKKEGNDTGVTV